MSILSNLAWDALFDIFFDSDIIFLSVLDVTIAPNSCYRETNLFCANLWRTVVLHGGTNYQIVERGEEKFHKCILQ